MTAFAPPPTGYRPSFSLELMPRRAMRAGLCLTFSAPHGIEGSRKPCRRGACWGACADGHDEACGSVRWRPRLLPRHSNHGRLRASEHSPPAGCLLGPKITWRFEPAFPLSVGFAPVFAPPLLAGMEAESSEALLPVDLVGLFQDDLSKTKVQLSPTPQPPAIPSGVSSKSCRSHIPSPEAAFPRVYRS